MKRLIVLVFASVVFAQAPGDLPPVPGRHVISLTPNPGRFSEPSIAINPANPQQVTVAYQSGASVGYSTDGGEHWTLAEGTAPGRLMVAARFATISSASTPTIRWGAESGTIPPLPPTAGAFTEVGPRSCLHLAPHRKPELQLVCRPSFALEWPIFEAQARQRGIRAR